MIRSLGVPSLLRPALAVLLLGTLLAGALPSRAQDTAHTVPTLEAMERQLALYQDARPEDEQKKRLKDLYLSAVQSLRDAAENREEQARFERLYADAPAKVARYTAELQALQRGARSASKAARNVSVSRLDRLLGEQRESLARLRNQETELARTVVNLQARVEPARVEFRQLGEAEERDAAPQPVSGESPQLVRARLDEWRARHDFHASLQARLDAEIHSLPERIAAVQAQVKLVAAQREQAERFVAELQGLERLQRIGDATRMRDEWRARIAGLSLETPSLRAVAEEVAGLADEHLAVVSRSEELNDEVGSASETLEELRGAQTGLRQQLEIAALSDALGPVLVEHYRRLSQFERPAAKLAELARQLSAMRLREFRIGQLLDAEPGFRERTYAALGHEVAQENGGAREALAALDSLLAGRVDLLEALARGYGESTKSVVALDEIYQEQERVAVEFRTLVDRNLVWMKSHPPLEAMMLLRWPGEVIRVLAAQDWRGVALDLLKGILARPFSALTAVMVLLLVLHYDARLRARLESLGLRTVGWRAYRFMMAVQALGIHLLLALPVPLVLWWAGWLVRGMQDAAPLTQALGFAAGALGVFGYGYLFVLEVLGPQGFARQHLRWKAARVQRLERVLRGSLWVLLPLALLTVMLTRIAPASPVEALPRVSGMLLALALLVCSLLAVRAGRGMFNTTFYGRSYPPLSRVTSVMVLGLLLAQPLTVVLDAVGYHFTASALLVCVFFTIVVLVVAKLILDTGLLGLAIAGNRSRAALATPVVEEARGEPDGGGGVAVAELGEDIDLEKMSASAIALMHVAVVGVAVAALILLWSQFFAALSVLDEVALWTYATTVDGKDVSATVSLFDLLGALLVLVLGLVLAKGLPALLGIVLIGFVTRKGLLFAIQTLISYVVGAIGVVAALQMLGFGWSKLQWMAAGLSVGLGFGLQEIFANFFAGLIMLFERPVRIGDVVTLGEYSGTIRNIRMRSTTLIDFDNREIIVPNKNFVTERLINWTLTSSVVRLSFDVGVSYAADPRLVRDTLLTILAEDPRVLADPPPNVIFREFGASSLNFRCFAHVEDVGLRFQVQNDLHMRITEVFREKGIEIAYPQMDLHLRTVDAVARDALGGQAQ